MTANLERMANDPTYREYMALQLANQVLLPKSLGDKDAKLEEIFAKAAQVPGAPTPQASTGGGPSLGQVAAPQGSSAALRAAVPGVQRAPPLGSLIGR